MSGLNLNLYFWFGALFFYVLGAGFYLLALKTNEPKWSVPANYLTYFGLVLQTLTLLIRWQEAGHAPLFNFYEVTSFFAWALIVFYLALKYRYEIQSLGAFILPVTLIIMISAMFLNKEIRPLPPVLQSKWLEIHVIISFFAYASFTMAAAMGVMYLLLEKQIKGKKPHAFYYRLPSLEIFDALNHRLLSLGFPLLTIAIIIGAFWSEEAWGSYWRWEPKETWALITWILYATHLHGRVTLGWRGKKSAYWSVLGLSALILTFWGVNALGGGKHVSLQNLP